MICGRLLPDGRVVEIFNRPPTYSDDVELDGFPVEEGPYRYQPSTEGPGRAVRDLARVAQERGVMIAHRLVRADKEVETARQMVAREADQAIKRALEAEIAAGEARVAAMREELRGLFAP